MINKTIEQQNEVLVEKSVEAFIEYYNSNIPNNFPSATHKTLDIFQTQHPSLFKKDDKWVINKHRKKYMDWLSSYHEE
ncbi:MAG: hypothetical protein Q8P73_02055 [bacterium]|nr:hypothetical protein [bacterium]